MVRNRKGQAAAAAALLAVIAGLIVLYILFIPPEEREKILGNGQGVVQGTSSSLSTSNKTLLTESPGRIDFLSQKKIEHTIPTSHIFTRTNGMVLEEKNSLVVKQSLFSVVEADMEFSVSDLANTNHIILGFNPGNGQGALTVLLNGEEVFAKELEGSTGLPITLPPKLLKASNILHFRVSSPGIAFWRTNGYALEKVQVTGDVTRTDAQRSKNVFIVSPVEFNNLDRASLRFQADCDTDFTGPLDAWINQFNVYSAVPDCGVGPVRLEIPSSYLKIGENEVSFNIKRGDYYLSHVAIESELKQIDFPVYFFELSEERFQDVRNETKKVIVRLDFVDTIEQKRGELVLNGHSTGFDTKELFVEKDVSDDIVRGNNGLKIKPEKTLDVRQLTVRLVPK